MAVTVDEEKARAHRERLASQSWYDVDSQLSDLLDIVFGEDDENPEGGTAVTVVAQGTVISGQLISAAKYREDQAASIETDSPELAASLRARSKAWEGNRDNRRVLKDNDSIPALRADLHFGEATVYSAAGRIQLDNVRVDLKDVSAWALGEVS